MPLNRLSRQQHILVEVADEAGRLLIGSDPSGAVFGVWQAAAHLGTDVSGVPGAPVWNELLTFESAGVAKFYERVFGLEAERSLGDDAVTLRLGGRPVAGIRGIGSGLPRDRGPHWVTYFEVADAADAVRRLLDLGGRVLTPVTETPRGLLARAADPEGARFVLLQSAGR